VKQHLSANDNIRNIEAINVMSLDSFVQIITDKIIEQIKAEYDNQGYLNWLTQSISKKLNLSVDLL